MRKKLLVHFFIFILILIFSHYAYPREINLKEIYRLTFEKDSFQAISQSTIDVEKYKILQTVSLYQPQLKLEHLTSKRFGDYDFEPVVRYGNFEVPIDINIFRTYETRLVFNQLLYDNNRIKLARQLGESEVYVKTWELKKYFYEELRYNILLYLGIHASINKIKLLEENLSLLDKTVS
ncbi:MAG TPA: hypothetical protein ENN73_02105, partial [Firmicutes bacterium]|nr:hypothetical protein [Bacillota bacterium]